ncbi:serine/threonine protein kinase [Trichophyton violaceum]|uniref:Serine/threonine protein kinase n=1 Tax=Trichophyton violaceum TaxID=34388 RepID=A0A178FKE5_TRIVO|nr:serine/threonine protein kinase [Trichophyton violaceum]
MLSQGTLISLAVRSCRNWACLNLRGPKFSNSRLAPSGIITTHHQTRSISTAPINSGEYIGESGRSYKIEKTLQEETFPPRRVCLANAANDKFILKYIHPVNFSDLRELNRKLRDVSHVRLPQDILPEKSMFVFEYFTGHLLQLAQNDLPLQVTKRILKDALRGLAELHNKDIVHTLGDLEDAAYIPPGSAMIGKQAGNEMWRSPEAHASGPVNKPSDIFSFALVCIYAVHKRVIFAVGEEELGERINPLSIILERQISYFANEDGIDGLVKYLGDSPWVHIFQVIRYGFNSDNPHPEKRITADEALAHMWFEGA